MPPPIASGADHHRGDPGDLDLRVRRRLAALDDVRVDVVRERRRRRDRQAGDHREDRGERDRGDQAQQHRPAQFEREQRRRGVHPARRLLDRVRADQRTGAVAQHQREQVEHADQHDRPDHRAARVAGRRHGVEAHQDVRQAGGAQHQGDAEREEVQFGRSGGAVLLARAEQRLAGLARLVDGGLQQAGEVEAVLAEHPQRHRERADDQQRGLDDLHPGGALHAADQDVGDHDDADHGDHQGLRAASLRRRAAAPPGHRRRPSAPAGRRTTRPASTSRPRPAPGAASCGTRARRPS